jgi:ribose/xylose/arabinose/galactoside ABC-type transport system permease subunit
MTRASGRWLCRRAAAGIATGMAVGAIDGIAVAWLRFPAFLHTLGMLLTVRAVALAPLPVRLSVPRQRGAR